MQYAQRVKEHERLIAMSTRVCERAELTLTFMEVGARAVISLFILSAMPGNIVVPACTTVTPQSTQQRRFDTHILQSVHHAPEWGKSYTSLQMCISPGALHTFKCSSLGVGPSKQQCQGRG